MALVGGAALATPSPPSVAAAPASAAAWGGVTAPAADPATIEGLLASTRHGRRSVGTTGVELPRLRAGRFVRALYAARSHEPLWRDPMAILTLRAALTRGELDGLEPAELRTYALEAASFDPFKADLEVDSAGFAAARRDILLTDTLIALADRLQNGTADPRGLAPLDDGPIVWRDPMPASLAELSSQLDAGDVADVIAEARPAGAFYRALSGAMAREIERREAGGLPHIGSGPTIKPGADPARIRRLRERLAATGELFAIGTNPDAYDSALMDSVRTFQERNGLEADGLVGRLTLAKLDLSVDERIERLRVNLERARWFERTLGDRDRIVVNVASFSLDLHLDGESVWQTDVIVGNPKWRTPVFVGEMTHVELDPSWIVPRSIVRESLFDRALEDVDRFAADGFLLRDAAGVRHDPRIVDWASTAPEKLPYEVVQAPGPDNALGRVKFLFPNRYSVYLHDTPARELFDESRRAFSHGCVRVRDPERLAELVLGRRAGLDPTAIDYLRSQADEVRVDLLEPLAVALLYWTADVDEAGRLRLFDDIYGRDAAVLDALAGRGARS